MNILLDFAIIYIACGAPFGVYYFLNNKHPQNKLLLKSFLTTVFWIPFAIRLLQTKVTIKLNKNNFKSGNQVQLNKLKKIFEDFLPGNFEKISLFELRETIERYVGLSNSVNSDFKKITSQEKEFYKITDSKNCEISAICLNRRNREKLKLHHTKAREDFLSLLKILFETEQDRKKLGNYAFEFVTLLNDETAQASLIQLIEEEVSQTFEKPLVIKSEKDLWTIQEQKHLKTKKINLALQTLTTTFNQRKKD